MHPGELSPTLIGARRDVIYEYLGRLPSRQSQIAESIADQLSGEQPLAHTIAIIPVAAHQEVQQIPLAVDQYARQQSKHPFSLVLGLNCPKDKVGLPSTIATIEAVEQAKATHPELDIRSAFTPYRRPIIGTVRRNLWNGVALAARKTGNFDEGTETIGLNHDIDIIKLAKSYIARVQDYYDRRDQRHLQSVVSPVAGTRMKHAYSPAHPHISSAVFWHDFGARQMDVTFEASLVIPMTLYANKGGFQETRTYETHSFGGHARPRVLRGTNAETSPRRFIERMPENGLDIWSDAATFTATDRCRETTNFPDISQGQLHDIIRGSMESTLRGLAHTGYREARNEWRLQGGDHYDFQAVENLETTVRERMDQKMALARIALSMAVDSRALINDCRRMSEDLGTRLVRHFMEPHKYITTREVTEPML